MTDVAFEAPSKEIAVDLPVMPVGWRILVRPYEPKKTWGEMELVVADQALESEALLTYVGQIVAMGNLCWQTTTRSGLTLSDIDPKPEVGDWIVFGTYGGQKIVTKAGTKYLLMNDDGVMAIAKDPEAFRAYL